LCSRTKRREIESRLFMRFWVLLTPEHPKQLRPVLKENQGASQRNHQVQAAALTSDSSIFDFHV